MSNRTPSIDELERRAEVSRAAFNQTVDQLRAEISETSRIVRSRVSPQAIKNEVKDYARRTGQRWYDRARDELHSNPLRTLAVGALCAYPALRLARSIPIPVALIGAGLLIAERTKSTDVRFANESFPGKNDGLSFESAAASIERTAAQLRQTASDAVDTVTAVASDGFEKVQRKAGDNLHAATEAASDFSSTAAAQIRGAAAAAIQAGKASAEAAGEKLTSSAEAAAARLSVVSHDTKEFAQTSFDKTPLAIGGLALLAGAIIAAALPATNIERTITGDAAETVKRRAEERANRAFQSAKDVVGGVAADMARTAGELGDAAADEVGQKVMAVAEQAVTTAFELPTEQQTSENSRSETWSKR